MKQLANLGEFSINVLKHGFEEKGGYLECVFCGFETERGLVYKDSETFCDAQRFMENHIKRAHNSVFAALIGLDKKVTGLSDHQCQLLQRFYHKVPDSQIQQELRIGSPSTIRNHRFAMKEKERQAKIFMTIMELIRENETAPARYVEPHATATMVDDRYKVTVEESEQILKKYFPNGLDGALKTFVLKEKSKLVVLRHIATKFAQDKIYTEKEINAILLPIYADYVTIRRYLIEYGFLDRKTDCSQYWLLKQ